MGKPSIDPQVWQPPPAPQRVGLYAPNDALDDVELWPTPGTGPEDIVVGDDGMVYTGLNDGRILRFSPDGQELEQLTNTGGWVLGLELLPDGGLLVCDSQRGLFRLDLDTRELEPLVTRVAGRPLGLTNNAAVAADGTIYFSESTTRHSIRWHMADIFEHSGAGSLWRRDPDGSVDLVLDGLSFANGVTLTPDGQAVLVAELASYEIHRVWLTGERQGVADTFAANLPGFPDNLSTGPGGTIWCALPSPRNALLDAMAPRTPLLRKLVWRIPEAVRPKATRLAFVLGFDASGQVTHNLQGSGERYHYVTGVREHDGWLYLGSVVNRAIARVRLPGGDISA